MTPNLSRIRDLEASKFLSDYTSQPRLEPQALWWREGIFFREGWNACEKYAMAQGRAEGIRDVIEFLKGQNATIWGNIELKDGHFYADAKPANDFLKEHFAADLAVLKGGEDEEN